MEYKIGIEEYATQKMIHVYLSGTLSESERLNIGVEIGRMCKENSINKAIFDIREAELGYSLMGSIQAVLGLSDLGMSENDYGAVIYSHNKDQLEYINDFARKRGIINVGFFQDIERGIAWLVSRK